MSEIKPEDLNSQAVPFFARFLEGQNAEDLSDQQSEVISGGCTAVTKKYPSDSDEAGTQQCPSGNEDAGVVTLKFPSDNEDALPTK
ncbi:MAG: microviridin/marinostatin family tricyclic proteinase inhibitor [Nostoc sp.]|uniref:microviridin/marinostatin family tricyclic proteinase inhibitor n=1 Tax=Nostoc sp. TaxID=1180 RepID=UPI002FF6E9A2